jgi:catalase
VSDGADSALVKALIADVQAAGGKVKIVAPKVGGALAADGSAIEADLQLAGGPSVLFDSVALVLSKEGAAELSKEAAAVAFVHDAYPHLKAIGHTAEAEPLLTAAGVTPDAAVVAFKQGKTAAFVQAAAKGKLFEREKQVRQVF